MHCSFCEQLQAAGFQLKQCHCSTSPRLDAHLYSAGTPMVPRCQARFARCWHFLAIITRRIETKVLALSDERNPLFFSVFDYIVNKEGLKFRHLFFCCSLNLTELA